MVQYREFEIEFVDGARFGDEVVKPTVMMSVEVSPDPYEDKWYTEELWLEVGTTEEQGIAIAKNWIDQFWLEQESGDHDPS